MSGFEVGMRVVRVNPDWNTCGGVPDGSEGVVVAAPSDWWVISSRRRIWIRWDSRGLSKYDYFEDEALNQLAPFIHNEWADRFELE